MRFAIVNEVEAYWEGLRAGRSMPTRAEVDPRGLERALANTFIVERLAPGVVRFRLSGQHLNTLMGMEVHGMPLSAFFTAETRPELAEHLERLFDAPQTLRLTLSAERGIGKPAMDGVLLLLPLRNELGEVTRALGCLATEGRTGRAPRRFRIAALQSRPLARIDQDLARQAQPAPGFAEAAAPFAGQPIPPVQTGPDPAHPTLTLIKTDE